MKRDRTADISSGSPLRIVFAYALFGALWILFSDRLVAQFVPTGLMEPVSIAKGWLFIAVTALLLHLLLGRQLGKITQVAAEARESAALFSSLLEQAAVGVAQIDTATGRFNRINRRYCDIVGYSPEEMKTLDFQAITHPDDLAQDLEYLRRMVAGEISEFSVEKRYLHKDGGVVWVNLTVSPLLGTGGPPASHIAVVEDITERKRAEKALNVSEMRFRDLLDNVHLIALLLDVNGKVTYCNNFLLDLIGFTDKEMLGSDWFELMVPDSHQAVKEVFLRGLKSGEIAEHAENPIITAAGNLRHVAWNNTVLRDAAGLVVGTASIGEDITDRKLVEQTRTEILNRVSDAFVALDKEWNYTFVNEQAAALFGRRPDDLVGKHIWNEFPEGVGEPFHQNYERAMREQVPVFFEEYFAPWSRWFENRVFPSEGGLSIFFHEITERKRAEEELQLYRDQLERLVEERTRELEEAKLALMNIVEDLNLKTEELAGANVRLTEVDRLKSLFIASMSHELRTPLNSVIGFSSILLNEWIGTLNDEQKKSLHSILRSGKHLLTLINDVIDVSKIEAGIIETGCDNFELAELLAELEQTFAKEAQELGLFLAVPELHLAMCTDRRRLLQCLLNLVSNALKFTEQGGVTVVVRYDEGEGEVTIAVTDSGIGIEAADQPRLFQPFSRIQSQLSAKVLGTGLGLYLTKKIVVDFLHGVISVKSEAGSGSTFSLTIPCRLAGEQEKQQVPVATGVKP